MQFKFFPFKINSFRRLCFVQLDDFLQKMMELASILIAIYQLSYIIFMIHLENQNLHLNDGGLMLRMAENTGNPPPLGEPDLEKDVKEWDLANLREFRQLNQLSPDKFLIEGSAREYMIQATASVDKKLFLRASYKILDEYSRNHKLSKGCQARLDRMSVEISRNGQNSQTQISPICLRNHPSSVSGKYLIFIIWGSGSPGCSDMYVWSPQGEILRLFSQIQSDSTNQEVLQELKCFRQCFCIILNTSMSRESAIQMVEALKAGQNEVILQLPNENPNMDYYCGQTVSIKTSKNHELWELFSIGARYIVSSYNTLSYFRTRAFLELRSRIMAMINHYCEQIKKLGNLMYALLSPQVLAIANNLIQISRANSVQADLPDKLWEFVDFLMEGSQQWVYEENQQFLSFIGNHYPAKMTHCLKCRVCKKNNRLRGKRHANCKKSKYICEGCSDYFGQKIHLCVICFRKFHKKIKFFMEIKSSSDHKKIGSRVSLIVKKNKDRKNEKGHQRALTRNSIIENSVNGHQDPQNLFEFSKAYPQ